MSFVLGCLVGMVLGFVSASLLYLRADGKQREIEYRKAYDEFLFQKKQVRDGIVRKADKVQTP